MLCTHLHADHIGWSTRLRNGRWVPTFQNARYLFAREEWEQRRVAECAPHIRPIRTYQEIKYCSRNDQKTEAEHE